MKNEVFLCPFNPSLCCTFCVRIAAKRTINLDQKDQGLVVVGLDLRDALKKRGGPLELPLGKASAAIKVVTFE